MDRFAGAAGRNDPFRAVAYAYNFVLVKDVLHNVLRVEAEIEGRGVPTDVKIGQGKFGHRFGESPLAVPMLERQRRFELSEGTARGARHTLSRVRTGRHGPAFESDQLECHGRGGERLVR